MQSNCPFYPYKKEIIMAYTPVVGDKVRLDAWPVGDFITVETWAGDYFLGSDKNGEIEPYLLSENWKRKSKKLKLDCWIPIGNGNRVLTPTATVNNNTIEIKFKDENDNLEAFIRDGKIDGFSMKYVLPEGEVV
jgi:hypothetical protein